MDAHLVGRRRELEALTGWLAAARDGRGRLALCAGEPGIGKTRLAQELAAQAAAQGVAVAWGRCAEVEGAPAYWPWRQVLRALGRDDALGGAERSCRRSATAAGSPEERFRLFDGVAEALRAAAHPALLVVLDDVHRADEPSLLVLRHLADRLADAPLLVLATFRDVEPADALRRALPELLRAGAVERLDLRGLGLDDVRAQLADPAQAQRVLDVTGGNPLFVREVARAIADGMWRPDRPPATVRDVVAARLERVSDPCRALVRAAAVVGRDFSLGLVAATLGGARRRVPSRRRRGGGLGAGRAARRATTGSATRSPATRWRPRSPPRNGRRCTAGSPRRSRRATPTRPRRTPPRPRAALGGARAVRRGRDGAAVGARGRGGRRRRLAYEEGVRLYRSALAVAEPRVARGRAVPRARRAGPGRVAVRRPRRAGSRPRGRRPAAPTPRSSRRRPRSCWRRCRTRA